MDYLLPIILIALSIALKKKIFPKAGEYFEKKWWIFLVLGLVQLILNIIRFIQES